MIEREKTHESDSAFQNACEEISRPSYIPPTVISYSDEDILGILGPARTLTGDGTNPCDISPDHPNCVNP